MTKERLKYLLDVHANSIATAAEKQELDRWYNRLEKDSALGSESVSHEEQFVQDRVWKQINRRLFYSWQYPAIAAAAVLAIVLSVGLLLYKGETTVDTGNLVAEIKPGTVGATLTLSDGQVIDLAGVEAGLVAQETGIKVSMTENGEILYTSLATSDGESNRSNTLSTRNGQVFTVVLPDRSKAYLNAGSVITYPTSFTGLAERRIKLSGEAYFEVTKDAAHPFIVETHDQRIAVLGTHFNVSAYEDDSRSTTTLLEGAVHVGSAKESQLKGKILKPGQQARIVVNSLQVKDVIAEDAIAWKEGYFRFDNETLEEAMKKIARWYDVRVSFQDPSIKKQNVYGTLDRMSAIGDVLQILELTDAVQFDVRGNEITAKKSNKL